MENLRKEDREREIIGKLGALDLLDQCIKTLLAHGRLFLLILVLIVFPEAAIEYTLAGVPGSSNDKLVRTIITPEIVKMARGNYTHFEAEPGVIASTIAMAHGVALIVNILIIFPYICVVYSVAAVVSNKTVALANAVGAVPRLWKQVLLTSLCLYAVSLGISVITFSIMYAGFLFSSLALIFAAGVVTAAVLGFVSFAFQLGLIIPVLEDVYGWKALAKSWTLLRGRKWVAFKITALFCLVVLLVVFASNLVSGGIFLILRVSINPQWKARSPAFFATAIKVVVRGAFVSVSSLLFIGTETFLYISCKARHKENLADSEFLRMEVMLGTYEQVGQLGENSEL